MCKLCENKEEGIRIKGGWLTYIDDDYELKAVIPMSFCPWCGEKLKGKERMMPEITPREWKYQMQEQEAENANS